MSSVSLPVTRSAGRALIIGNGGYRIRPLNVLTELGFGCGEADDPYGAMAELCRRPDAYRALILSLQSLYKEELTLILAVKQRFPDIEVWLTDTDGRQGALAEAMRLGAEGLLAEDGLHRIAVTGPAQAAAAPPAALPARPIEPVATVASEPRAASASRRPVAEPANEPDGHPMLGEPVLTAEELRALLHEPVPSPGKVE